MSTLQAKEAEKYEQLASAAPTYGDFSPAERFLPIFLDVVGADRGTVLDAGCCTGKGGLLLAEHGFTVTLCDITDAHLVSAAERLPFFRAVLWHEFPFSVQYNYVVCCDVLEHIPPEFTMLVVRNLLAVSRCGVFFTIGLMPDVFGAAIGERLHLTVQSFVWWRDRLAELGEVLEARDLLTTGVYFVRPRS